MFTRVHTRRPQKIPHAVASLIFGGISAHLSMEAQCQRVGTGFAIPLVRQRDRQESEAAIEDY
jgi:hypothetical protein